jgi:NitT/TauT family transport system ATP-binding protein
MTSSTATSSRERTDPLPGDPILRVSGVSKTYATRGVDALGVVDFELHRGQFASIIGPSGCGKSTLLKIMAGLLRPTMGQVILSGTPVTAPRREIGMMFQEATLLPWLTARQNVLLPIEVRDSSAAAKARTGDAQGLLDMMGLTGFGHVYPHELSGGMLQRVAICRMLITEPVVLLLDEPFGALDELTREYMNLELQRICRDRRATAFMVTHSIPEAIFMGDVVFVMSARPGRLTDVVPVDLPRPRTLDMMTEPAFGEIVRHVRALLSAGGMDS